MNDAARTRILDRLRAGSRPEVSRPQAGPEADHLPERSAMIERLKSLLEAMRAQVHRASEAEWLAQLKSLLRDRGIKTLLFAPQTWIGAALSTAWAEDAEGLPELVAYAEPAEALKNRIFAVDSAITGTAGAVADTGALILRPDSREPRLMSLVPPIHIAVLRADGVFPSLGAAMQAGRWAEGMPTNIVLVSGPSKTADIELTLAFGVHGPKELVVLILE